MAITFSDDGAASNLQQKRRLKAFLKEQITGQKPLLARLSVCYVFVNDERLLEMNQQFLQHDTLTDIITFPLINTDTELESEIYISIPRVAENAAKFSVAAMHELHRVIFHGALHLCGMQDKTKQQQQQARAAENEWLRLYFDNDKPGT